MSRIPLLLLMLGIDFLVLRVYFDSFTQLAQSYWAVHLVLYLSFMLMPQPSLLARDQPMARDFRALLTGLYTSKFFGLAVFAIGALLIGAADGIAGILNRPLNLEMAWVNLRSTGLVLSIGLFVSLLYGMIRNRHRYTLRSVQVPIRDLPEELDGFTIVQFSDAHLGSITNPEKIQPAIDLINEQQADLVCFTGDLVNSVAEEAKPFVEELSRIQARHGVVAILGNHDYGDYVRWPNAQEKRKNFSELIDLHEQLNWKLLRDDSLKLNVQGRELIIIGVENISGKGQFKNYGDLKKAYPTDQEVTKILLTHDPTHWRSEVLEYKDIVLSLSGHTHGMQFGLEIGNRKWSPAQWIYKEWAGLYQEGEQFLYVNRGFGFLGYPGRVGILPEITRIELKCKGNS